MPHALSRHCDRLVQELLVAMRELALPARQACAVYPGFGQDRGPKVEAVPEIKPVRCPWMARESKLVTP